MDGWWGWWREKSGQRMREESSSDELRLQSGVVWANGRAGTGVPRLRRWQSMRKWWGINSRVHYAEWLRERLPPRTDSWEPRAEETTVTGSGEERFRVVRVVYSEVSEDFHSVLSQRKNKQYKWLCWICVDITMLLTATTLKMSWRIGHSGRHSRMSWRS